MAALAQTRNAVFLAGEFIAELNVEFSALNTLPASFRHAGTATKNGLRHFLFAHHDCILFQVLDDDELDFGFKSTMRFVDSETGAEITTSPDIVRREYLERFGREVEDLQLFCSRSNIDYHQLRSSQPLAASLAAYLNRREKFR